VKENVAEPPREVDVKVEDWARPILEHLDERERRKRVLNIVMGALVLTSVVLWPILALYMNPGWVGPYFFSGIVGAMLVLFGVEYLLDRFSPVNVTPPQAYSIHILRIMNRSKNPGSKFDDAVIKFVRRMDIDLNELQGNLAASRTFKVVGQLRTLMLKFATAVKENREEPIKSMRQVFGTTASWFYRFEDVEELASQILGPELKTRAIEEIPERTSLTSPARPYVKFLRKWPVTMTALFGSFGGMAYIAYFVLGNPFYAILVGFALTIVIAYRRNVGRWVREKWGE